MATNNDESITPPHSHPLQKWILFGLIIVVGLLSLYFGYIVAGKNQLKKAQQEYRDKGYPITLQDLNDWYPTPVGDNAADLYLKAIDQMVNYPDWDPGKEILAAFERQAIDDGSFYDDDDDEEGSPPELEDDKALINRVLPYIGKGKMPELGKRIDPATLALIESYVQANRQAIETIYKAMVIKECRYPVDVTEDFGYCETKYLSLFRPESHLVALQALVDTHADRPGKAVRSLLTIHAIAQSLENDPDLISRLLVARVHAIALSETERILNLILLSDNELVQLSNECEILLKSDGLFRAIVAEYVLIINAFEDDKAFKEIYGSYLDFNVPLLKRTGQYDRDYAACLKIAMARIQYPFTPLSVMTAWGYDSDRLGVIRRGTDSH